MTAAPGPQQPDEVCGAPCEHGGRESTRRRSTSNLGWQGHCNRVTGGGPCWQHRPAAPSAQPDERCVCCNGTWRLTDRLCVECTASCVLDCCVYNPARHRQLPDGWAGLPRHRFSAQPVRDTKEGRR